MGMISLCKIEFTVVVVQETEWRFQQRVSSLTLVFFPFSKKIPLSLRLSLYLYIDTSQDIAHFPTNS